jgi:uncharacterized membrane protein YedE/YeeE
MSNYIYMSLMGGVLIGVAVTLMLLFNGRVTGISGIVSAGLAAPKKDNLWRITFIVGMLVGGLILKKFKPELMINGSNRGLGAVVFAGLLVGYGTVMAGGCTSGHGICGVSRFSVRSIVATITFILFGFLAVAGFSFFTRGQL